MPANSFRAGAATSNITPALGTSLNGGMADRQAAHIHDELHARCLVLDDGHAPLALVVCDLCVIPRDILDAAKHMAHGYTGIPPDRMLISATHTHSAPTVVSVFQSEPNLEYADFLVLRIADGLRRAMNNLVLAKVGWGLGREPTQVFNRRWRMKPGVALTDPFGRPDQVLMNPPVGSADLVEPSGPTDPEVAVLAVQTSAGQPLAVLANYSLHYVGGTGPGDVSADYYGVFAALLARKLAAEQQDPPFVALMSNGTSGNINNIDFRHPAGSRAPYEQIRTVAELLAAETARVYQRIEFHEQATLDARYASVELARRLPSPDEVARARFVLSQGEGEELKTREEIYARETVQMSDWPATIDVPVQALRIGALGIAALPCEVFVETGLAIKHDSPLRPTFTIELANGYAGYLPTAEHHRLGGYETWRARSSFLEVDAEAKLRAKVLEMLKELAA